MVEISTCTRPASNRLIGRESGSETSFIDLDSWDACVDHAATPVLIDQRMPIWVSVDASVKRDSTAIVACTFDPERNKVRLVAELNRRFYVREIRYAPYQLVAVAQRLTAAGLPIAAVRPVRTRAQADVDQSV